MTREEAHKTLLGYIFTERLDEHIPDHVMDAVNMAANALLHWEPVVRCKDCDRSHLDFDEHGEVTFRCRLYDPLIVYVGGDGMGYCSNGRRRE